MKYFIIKVEADSNDDNRDLEAEIHEMVSKYLASRNISARCDVVRSEFLSLFSKSKHGITKGLRQDEIIYIEKNRHKVIIHTYNGSYEFYASLKSLELQLNPDMFMRVHQGFIVNTNEINVLYSNEIALNSIDIRIPLSRRNRKRLNQKLKKLH